MDVEQAIRDYLPDIPHMSLATNSDKGPWICEVHYAYDADLNLYFRSLTSRRHSQEIAKDPRVVGNIATQHEPADLPRCVTFEGTAELIPTDEERFKMLMHFKSIDVNDSALTDAKDPEYQVYKITVQTYYLFDARVTKPAQKFKLDWNGGVK